MITKVEVFGVHRAPTLSLGGFMPSDDPVHIRNIDGLGPVKAEITTTPSGTSRGETKQGSSVGKRNIVMTLGYNPNWAGGQTISSLRKLLYGYFMTQQWVKLRFYSDDMPTVDIEGTVEDTVTNHFAQDPEVQVSIICERPDFVEIDASIYKGVVDDGSNQLEVDYQGSVSSGLEIRIDRSVDLPAYSGFVMITVDNFEGRKTITVDSATIDTTKSFKMSSIPSQKRVQLEALVDGAITNLLKVKSGDWPSLQPGENLISVRAGEPGQSWTLAFFNRYGGL